MTYNPNSYPFVITGGSIKGTICDSPNWVVTGGTLGPNLTVTASARAAGQALRNTVTIVGHPESPATRAPTASTGASTSFPHTAVYCCRACPPRKGLPALRLGGSASPAPQPSGGARGHPQRALGFSARGCETRPLPSGAPPRQFSEPASPPERNKLAVRPIPRCRRPHGAIAFPAQGLVPIAAYSGDAGRGSGGRS